MNAINLSIRHTRQDPGSLLAWAKQDVFSFVLFYEQQKTTTDSLKVQQWTHQLIEAALACDGSFYLPYQIQATPEQCLRAYPHAEAFFQLKKQVDPSNKFSNKLWQSYYPLS